MIFCENKIFAKVWKSTVSDNGKYIDLQISTSEKDDEGNYKNSNWFPRAIGHAANTLKNAKREDRITITRCKFSNESYEDKDGNKKSSFRFLILEAEIDNGDGSKQSSNDEQKETKKASKGSKKEEPKKEAEENDCPW